MISVRNHQLRLNGNKWFVGLALALLVGACTPKVRVLRGTGTSAPPETSKPADQDPSAAGDNEEETVAVNNIALLLPFELDKANPHAPSTEDIKRSALALDFYQGFKLGLDALAEKGTNFKVNVLDTRDDAGESARIAKQEEVQEAALVVGPVYPREIQVFGFNASLKDALQVSPLAASMPSEFNLPNLVTLTAPITAHVQALAARIAEQYKPGDAVIFYQTEDAAGKQFLSPLKMEIDRLNKGISVVEVSDGVELESRVHLSGKNLVVLATTNKYEISPILAELRRLNEELSYQIELFGHPNWAKLGFGESDGLAHFHTVITSSYYVDHNRAEVSRFDEQYRREFGIPATEFAYKGYDAAYYFGGLLHEYGADYKDHLTEAKYKGLHNVFKFSYDAESGYVNNAVSILQYRNGHFQP